EEAVALVLVEEGGAHLVPERLLVRALLHVEELVRRERLPVHAVRSAGRRRHVLLRGTSARRPFTRRRETSRGEGGERRTTRGTVGLLCGTTARRSRLRAPGAAL